MAGGIAAKLRAFELATRPVPPELEQTLARRWNELPEHVKSDSQALGRRTAGCEGTHGVFPRCNLACTPCYHSREATRVRTDGAHTVAEVERQMAHLNARRGPGQNAQLIGGEVTLLDPDDHAAALLAMRRHGRKPMSMTHGDFDYAYLERLVLDADGRVRLPHVSFAGHFDSMMFGRRGSKRVHRESDLNEHRRRFCELFQRLEREHGVTHYLAHNMTVTPRNIDQVADVVRACRDMGFRMLSFQPAAFIGNERRWKDSYRELSGDDTWAEIERGLGARLPYKMLQIGDERCNRTAYGALVGPRWVPLLDDRELADHDVRDRFFRAFGGMDFDVSPPLLAAKLARVAGRHPGAVTAGLAWLKRFAMRAGVLRLARTPPRALTLVMHSFMDARDVKPAWDGLRAGRLSDEPRIRETQERLQACSYAMSHPDSDELVPACVQHSVLDPAENLKLQELLPLVPAA
jgi:MoaA/NifB/PqqE/SkfB family radical SAM enzyme